MIAVTMPMEQYQALLEGSNSDKSVECRLEKWHENVRKEMQGFESLNPQATPSQLARAALLFIQSIKP